MLVGCNWWISIRLVCWRYWLKASNLFVKARERVSLTFQSDNVTKSGRQLTELSRVFHDFNHGTMFLFSLRCSFLSKNVLTRWRNVVRKSTKNSNVPRVVTLIIDPKTISMRDLSAPSGCRNLQCKELYGDSNGWSKKPGYQPIPLRLLVRPAHPYPSAKRLFCSLRRYRWCAGEEYERLLPCFNKSSNTVLSRPVLNWEPLLSDTFQCLEHLPPPTPPEFL